MKKWIILILIAALWGFGAILAWTMRDAGSHVFMYYGEGDAVEKQLISLALDREQEQGRYMLPEITAWSRAKRLKVMNPGLGRSGEADCIAVYGLMEMASYPRLIEEHTATARTRTDALSAAVWPWNCSEVWM
ncbi:MAG: hypothetical protein ACLTBV_27670 [Enterocloster bolteae]